MESQTVIWARVIGACAAVFFVSATALPISAQTTTQQNEVLAAAFTQLIPGLRPGTVAVCISLLGDRNGTNQPDSALLARLSAVRPVVRADACPRTYASMVSYVDSLGRPKDPPPPAGYVDPTTLTFGLPQFDRADHAYIYVRETQGMGGREFLCTFSGAAVVRCRPLGTWSS